MATLTMCAPAPALDLPLVGGGRWRLDEQRPTSFTLVVFYRGLHCPRCKDQLMELDSRLDAMSDVGVDSVVAVSGDDAYRAATTVADWELDRLPVAYGLTEDAMRRWGLFVSKGVKDPEPELFNEPGMILVAPDTTLYSAHIQSVPFARPHLDNLINSVRWITEHDYPARGEA